MLRKGVRVRHYRDHGKLGTVTWINPGARSMINVLWDGEAKATGCNVVHVVPVGESRSASNKTRKSNPTKPNLTALAKEYARRRPASNPDDDDLDRRIDGFIIEQKQLGTALSTWTEVEWRKALSALGVSDKHMPIYLEQMAGWGVDD